VLQSTQGHRLFNGTTKRLVSFKAIKETHLLRMMQLMTQYVDLPMALADAAFVLLAEELGHGRIVFH